MRGHTKIIEMRLQKTRPAIVFLNDYHCQTDWFEFGEHATVCTAGDPLSSLDLRFLVGCTVSISALTEGRAKALFSKAKDAGATTVVACHVQPEMRQFEQSGWTEVWRKPVKQLEVA